MPPSVADAGQRLTVWAALGTTSVCRAMNAVFSVLAVGRVSPMLLVALRWTVVPVFASAMAVGVLGERLQGYHFAALALVLGGIYLSERGIRQPRTAPSSQAGIN